MAKPKPNPRRSYRRDVLWKRVRALGQPCWICGLPIPLDAPAGTPLAFELDELLPVSKGGDPADMANTAPAHRCCNQWRSDRSVSAVGRIRDEVRRRFGPWPSALAFCEGARAVSRGAKGKSAQVPVRHPKRRSGAL
ncbi:hypothetical protein [Collinsella sp. An7]|uniref:hypothetical protein n=1 Tax=Collinsella sp. An7 TaxID=1965651 RepID=UPI00194FA249|nr:hypothetical protein [Collinsella sp. An7]